MARTIASVLVLLFFSTFLATTANAATITHHARWGQIVKRCNHTRGCTSHIPAGIRADLGIGNHPARWFIGDTSVIYVKYGHTVKRFES